MSISSTSRKDVSLKKGRSKTSVSSFKLFTHPRMNYENNMRRLKGSIIINRRSLPVIYTGFDWNTIGDMQNVDAGHLTERDEEVALLNEALAKHFLSVVNFGHQIGKIDLELVDNLLQNGAQINITDNHGQTLLHEAAHIWHVDVANFFIKREANVNQADKYGRTPLHVAAILNYTELIEVLLSNNANIDAKTIGEEQTPFHYAAKYDAVSALYCLHKHGADIQVEDYRKRTPLHLAAVHGRSDAARLLLQLGCRTAVTDITDESCLNMLVYKIPYVGYEALNQFHATDEINKMHLYYLKQLEPLLGQEEKGSPKTLLELIVYYRMFSILKHPVVQRLIDVKWDQYGFGGACILLLLKFFFIISWTMFMTLIDWDQKRAYHFPEDWWRVGLITLCIIQLLILVEFEFMNLFNTKTKHEAWKKKEKMKILMDKKYCHPSWPGEEAFVRKQLADLKNTRPQYYTDYWCFYAWAIVILLLGVTVSHVADVVSMSNKWISQLHLRVVAITLPVLCLWNIKDFRPFRTIGPFIVLIGNIIPIFFKFIFICIQFFIPFGFSYYLVFGGNQYAECFLDVVVDYFGLPPNVVLRGSDDLPEMKTVSDTLVTMFRMWIFNDYNIEKFYSLDPVMTYILIGTFIGLESIVAINVLIAMLNAAFLGSTGDLTETLYMQKAIVLLQLKKLPFFATKFNILRNIQHIHGPVVESFNTRDGTLEEQDDIKDIVFEIKTTLEEFIQKIQKDEHSLFLEKMKLEFGEEEIIGNRATALSMETMESIHQDVKHLQRIVIMLHRQQIHSYNHLKDTIKSLNTLLEKELHYDSRKDGAAGTNGSYAFSLLDSVTSRLSQIRRRKQSEESVVTLTNI